MYFNLILYLFLPLGLAWEEVQCFPLVYSFGGGGDVIGKVTLNDLFCDLPLYKKIKVYIMVGETLECICVCMDSASVYLNMSDTCMSLSHRLPK